MHIKKISIQGFRSYREASDIEVFSPKHNIIVGRNGSGKSNFFCAIQFVLSDEYNNLRAEQRAQLLHEGTGARVISACVEMVFDNSDNRLPIDKDEVTLRRVIGSKKDQYFLDKKMVTKSDVLNLLESAGFSRSNPYYIVKQGKINQMATAPDSQRLQLLREVAGTRVYDERKDESRELLKESESRRAKIEDVLKLIRDRLGTLEQEKEELKNYQRFDKDRRALEYTIHNQELNDTRTKLQNLSTRREHTSAQTKMLREQQEAVNIKLKTYEREQQQLMQGLKGLYEEKDQNEKDRQHMIQKKAQLELAVQDLNVQLSSDQQLAEQANQELERILQEIRTKQQEKDDVDPRFQEQLAREKDLNKRLHGAEQRRKELYAKQGRGNQFNDRQARDEWIRKELKTLNRGVKDKETQIANLEEEIRHTEEEKKKNSDRIQENNMDLQEAKGELDKLTSDQLASKAHIDEVNAKRQKLWRTEASIQQEKDSLKSEIKSKEHLLNSLIGKAAFHGIESIHKVMQNFREQGRMDMVDGYKGMLIENFRCNRSFYTCVQVTAGGKLFNHIVATDRIGTMYLNEMNRLRLPGEVTFLPLNKLEMRDVQYPQTKDAIPMINKLEYDDDYRVAMRYVFGKTLICRSMEVSTQLARRHQLDCITLEGDVVSRRGALTGGYVDNRTSKLEIYTVKEDLMKKLHEKEKELKENKEFLQRQEQDAVRSMEEAQKQETKIKKIKDEYEKLKVDTRMLRDQEQSLHRALEPKQRSLGQLMTNRDVLRSTKTSLEEEMGTDLLSQLSMDDQREVDRLNDDIKQIKEESTAVIQQRIRLEGQKTQLENLLQDNLFRRKEQFESRIRDYSVDNRRQCLEQRNGELIICTQRYDDAEARFRELEEEVGKKERDNEELKLKIEENQSKQRDCKEKMSDDARELEKATNKQSMLIKKKEECMRKIRDLGSLPQDAFEKYQGYTHKTLMKELEKCNKELKKYSHVNKKALDQYVSFNEQKEKLLARKEEIDRGREAISNLMEHLEHEKYEAIQLTFRQVSKNFSDVFQKLVPGGKATLIMKKGDLSQKSSSSSDPSSSSTEQSASIVDQFVGIGIKVSFSGEAAETREMQQLSGGQKSLVALALIFAIQKCDPAPFYLFDEIDQALDPAHRASVANMLSELSENAQFITTTFRPELLEAADKFYGVIYRNKMSLVKTITKDMAKEFVEDDEVHG